MSWWGLPPPEKGKDTPGMTAEYIPLVLVGIAFIVSMFIYHRIDKDLP